MKKSLTIIVAFMFSAPYASFGQGGCSGQLDITYPSGIGNIPAQITVNNGSSQAKNTTFCTSPNAQTLTVKPASDGTLALQQSLDGGLTYTTLPNSTINPSVSGTTYTFMLPTRTTDAILYRLFSTVACPNPKNITFTLSLASALQFRSASPTVCPGSSTTLTAVSDLPGATYTFTAPGQRTVSNTTGTLVVSPTVTTTYSVSAGTQDCGASARQVIIVVPDVTLSVEPASAIINAGQAATITAVSNVVAGTTYTFQTPGQLPITNSTGVLSVSPTSTATYTVTANTLSSCSTASQSVTVTVNKPLPVSLVSFSGSRHGDAAYLTWTTATEFSNDYFAVERSADGKEFAPLARVTGAGSSATPRTYGFTDERALATTVYYRLRQVDYDGKGTYSSVVALAARPQSAAWLQYGSAPHRYTVQGALDANSRFTLLDVMGRTVYTQAVTLEHPEVTVPALPTGIYLFRLTTTQGRFTVRQALSGDN